MYYRIFYELWTFAKFLSKRFWCDFYLIIFLNRINWLKKISQKNQEYSSFWFVIKWKLKLTTKEISIFLIVYWYFILQSASNGHFWIPKFSFFYIKKFFGKTEFKNEKERNSVLWLSLPITETSHFSWQRKVSFKLFFMWGHFWISKFSFFYIKKFFGKTYINNIVTIAMKCQSAPSTLNGTFPK
jgi:hypothetical protein